MDEHNNWPRMVKTELKMKEVVTLVHVNCSKMVGKDAAAIAAAWISHCTCHNILSGDLNTSHVARHSVPLILTQDQHDNHMNICSDLTDSANKDGRCLNLITTGDEM
jgi:hypothetical protein